VSDKEVTCELCPRGCHIQNGRHGYCRARFNNEGTLVSLVYGKPCSAHIDPIEKKPLFHFLPSSKVFSIATAGCNLHCLYCQNWDISQKYPDETDSFDLMPEAVVHEALTNHCPSVAYTYTEPCTFYEYALDSGVIARKKGIKNVLVTAGYLNEDPAREIFAVTDGASITLKGNAQFYRDVVGGTRAPVERYIKTALKSGVHVELIHLVVPTMNDKPEELREIVSWIANELGPDVPLHFSRFFPLYKLANLYPTPMATLLDAAHMAVDMGLHYVYVGNTPPTEFENTKCPRCKKAVIRRTGFEVIEMNLENGRCKFCKESIPGVWK
jgi:pyruvate formate lyase activating enzyme